MIATKADKIKRSQLATQTKMIRAALSMSPEDTLIVTSASSKAGLSEVWKVMEEKLAPAAPSEEKVAENEAKESEPNPADTQ